MAKKWMLCMALVGCGLGEPQGPTDLPQDPWKRVEEQRLEALEENAVARPGSAGCSVRAVQPMSIQLNRKVDKGVLGWKATYYRPLTSSV